MRENTAHNYISKHLLAVGGQREQESSSREKCNVKNECPKGFRLCFLFFYPCFLATVCVCNPFSKEFRKRSTAIIWKLDFEIITLIIKSCENGNTVGGKEITDF